MDIFQYEFMVRALLAGLVVSIICPFIGVFLVFRRLSFMADTIAHISLAGIATGLTLGFNSFLSTAFFALSTAIGIEKLRKDSKVFDEAILALIMSGGIALAVVLISLSKGFNVDIFSYLFGSLLTVSNFDLALIIVVGIVVVVAMTILFNQLFLISFDEETAKTSGLAVTRINLIFAILVGLTVSVAMKIVGVLLVSALMVIPVLSAMQISNSFKQLVISSILLGLIGTIVGLFFAYYLNLASGGAIVLTLVSIFFSLFVFQKVKLTIVKRCSINSESA